MKNQLNQALRGTIRLKDTVPKTVNVSADLAKTIPNAYGPREKRKRLLIKRGKVNGFV